MFDWLKKLLGFTEGEKTLTGDGTWHFVASIDGDDIVVTNAKTTWFGGSDDPEDNGATASGTNTKRHPDVKGCALPMSVGPCAGSPIPRVPWGTMVAVTHPKSGKTITSPVIDLGPARHTGNAIDLTPAAFAEFAPRSVGKLVTNYRIYGAAKFVTA